MLTFEEIKELIELVASHRMTGIEVERSGFRLKIDGYQAVETVAVPTPTPAAAAAPVAAPAAAAPEPVAEAPPAPPAESAAATDVIVQNSPIVGTFYRRPSPEQPPLVEVGETVSRGQVLCIIEAMKLMNEIESETDGVVVEILPKNSQAVEFGEPLFKIKAS